MDNIQNMKRSLLDLVNTLHRKERNERDKEMETENEKEALYFRVSSLYELTRLKRMYRS